MKDSTPGSSLFRKQALARLSSPDRLAQRVSLISPRWWLALLALVLVLCVALLWAWHGRIATKVHGTGIFMEKSGLYNLVAGTDGVLERLDVVEGMIVSRGDVLGMIFEPMHEQELRRSRDRLESVQAEMEDLSAATGRHRQERFAFLDQVAADNAKYLAMMESVLDKLEVFSYRLGGLKGQGLITELESVRILQETMRASMDLSRKRLDSLELEVKRSDHDLGLLREFWERQQRLLDAEQDLLARLDRFAALSQITSPIGGMVVAVQKTAGDGVASGDVVAVLQPSANGNLYVSAFVPAAQGKSVQPGQPVHVAPGHIAPQRWGYMVGEVADVGQYPTTLEQMTAVFKNPDLARMIQGNSAMMKVRVRLAASPDNQAGWSWTGKAPEDPRLSPGTLCTVFFITEQRAPITYVMPWVREKLLGQGSMPPVREASSSLPKPYAP
jgi:HlyD family secretion protein